MVAKPETQKKKSMQYIHLALYVKRRNDRQPNVLFISVIYDAQNDTLQ